MTKSSRAVTARALAILMALLAGAGEALSAIIPVTTVQQKISSSGGCSLQEAIFSANLDNNVAIARYSGTTPVEVITQCVPGSGDDIIVLPAQGELQLSKVVDDHINPAGPTATPIITSRITILAYGATLRRIGSSKFRLFAVGSTGHLTIRGAYIADFWTHGGNGGHGAGGGMGAGGAIYVIGGGLVVEASTLAGNAATGGTGGVGIGGGGGGVGGAGGPGFCTFNGDAGGGGGGARGAGSQCFGVTGGGGGGTLGAALYGDGGFACGGDGGNDTGTGLTGDGQSGECAGGGGGGGGTFPLGLVGHDGGSGSYGGGGGGGDLPGGGTGGRGGFGGGGGASGVGLFFGADGGNGGFGGGGGAGHDGEIADGNLGDGGFFAGDGGSDGGGGGAGLGGAIFNDHGTVDVRNSTFTGNVVSGGFSERAQDGISGGGAIFSVNGHLTVLNTTIAGHIAHVGSGILVAQTSATAPTSFVLQNSIIASNSGRECAITGFSLGVSFAGNLIVSNADGTAFDGKTFVGCEGIVTSADPQLGTLQYNQGATPTLAISATSPARNAADPATSLPVDQRKQPRPAMGGFDIGAFELCLEGFGRLQQPCLILAGIEDPGGGNEAFDLTINVNPLASGVTVPAPGVQQVPKDSVVALNANPNPGFRFTGWSANVTNPGVPATTVVMGTSQTVTANFAACECPADVTSSIGIRYSGVTLNPATRKYVQTVTLTNNSAATIAGPISLVLDMLTAGVTLANGTGSTMFMLPAGSPYRNAITSLAPGQPVALQLQFTNPGNVVFSYEPRVLAGAGSR